MGKKNQPRQTRRAANHFWQVKNLAGNDAELILYGTISDTSWWGDEITPKQFVDDIKSLGSIDTLTVRINSGGGDVFAAQAIGAQIDSLNKAGTETVCRIDGLCASAATIIAGHCSKVVANSDALYMIHLPSVYLFDACDENDLQAYLSELQAVKDSILQLYAKKTGKDLDELTDWMNATTWFTANEAQENGFIDEVDEAAEPSQIENRSGALFVNSVDTGLCMDEAPESVKKALRKQRPFSNTQKPAAAPENEEEPKMAENLKPGAPAAPAITTVDALRTAYPDLVSQIENEAAQSATNTERARIKDIYMDTFINESRAKGKGWHQVTAAEWAAVALWSHRNGITPKGNNNFGKDKTENIYSADTMARDGKTGNILYVKTGTGPVTWTHNGQADGIWDMAGNGYEWNIGTAVLNGELLIIQNNDAADSGCDLADTSAAWKAIRASDGVLITPDGNGTTWGSVKLNNNGGRWQYSDEVTNSQSYGVGCSFAKVTADSCIGGKTKLLLQALALLPDTALVGDNVDAGYGKEELLAYNAEAKMLHQVHGSFFFTNESKGQLSARFTVNAARDEIGPSIGGRLAYIDLPE